MALAKTPPIKLADFEQISRAILGMLLSEKANIAASCLFFGLIGESILKRHYKLDARAVVGEAFYRVNDEAVLAFAQPGFHCWIEADGWLIDFSSLVFPEMLQPFGLPACRRLMFQKPLSESALALVELKAKGGFYCLADSALTQAHRAAFHGRAAYDDLLNIVTDWYRKPPKTLPTIGVQDKYGHTKPVAIARERLMGVW